MPRYSIPSTNTSFNSDLQPAFGTYNLGTMGSRIYPRETSGGTAVSELVPSSFIYVLPTLRVWNDNTNSYAGTSVGTVEFTSPFTLGPGSTLNPLNFRINDDTYTTITITATPAYGFSFNFWANGSGTFITSTNPYTVSISNSVVYNNSIIRAEFN